MGQVASAASQQSAVNSPSKINDDAFRHFRDDRGSWSQSNDNNNGDSCNNQNHNNSNNNQNRNYNSNDNGGECNRRPNQSSDQQSYGMNGCLFTDATRPNGGPMARETQMEDSRRDSGAHGSQNSFSKQDYNRAPAYSPPQKAEASTMMSTAFLQRGNPPEECGVVQFKIDTVDEECHVSEKHADNPQDFSAPASSAREEYRRHDDTPQKQHRNAGGMTTFEEVNQHQGDAPGMDTCDEPIMAMNFQPKPAPKEHHHHQATPPRGVSHDTGCSSYSTAMTSVSRQQVPSAVEALNVADELKMRESFNVGSVIEVFSSSGAKWYVAYVAQVGEKATAHMITVQFVGDNGQILQKSMPRSDVQLAVFGRNTRQMPPGFQKVASESRPGQFSYLDSASGAKYQTKELAWQNYYATLLKSEQAQELLRNNSLKPAAPEPAPQAASAAKAAEQAAAVEKQLLHIEQAAAAKAVEQAAAAIQAAVEQAAAAKLKQASLQPAPTMSLARRPSQDHSSDIYASSNPVLAKGMQPANNLSAAVTSEYYIDTNGAYVAGKPPSRTTYISQVATEVGTYDQDGAVARPRTQSFEGANASMLMALGPQVCSRPSYSNAPTTVSDLRPSYSNAPTTVSDLRSVQPATPLLQPQYSSTSIAAQTVSDVPWSAEPQKQSSSGLQKAPFAGYGQSFAVGTSAGYEAYLASQGLA